MASAAARALVPESLLSCGSSSTKRSNVSKAQNHMVNGRVSGDFDGKLWFLTSIFCFKHFRDVVSHHFHDLKWLKLSHVMGIVGIQ